MAANNVFLIVTSHDALGETGHKTGFWYEELAAPYYVFKDAGLTPVIVSAKGKRPPVDPASEAPDFRTPSVERFAVDGEAQSRLEGAVTPQAAPADPAALFLVGGHGSMWDFPDWSRLAQFLRIAHAAGTPIGAVCHGVAGLLSYQEDGDHPLVTGRRLTGFTNSEEVAVGLDGVVPFLLQDRLTEAGAAFSEGPAFSDHVLKDGLLVTGQNPSSSPKAAEEVLALLASK